MEKSCTKVMTVEGLQSGCAIRVHVLIGLDPLNPNSDQHQISPHRVSVL